MSATETSFDRLAGVPVHHDRLLAHLPYGSKSDPHSFRCRQRLKGGLDTCLPELFQTLRPTMQRLSGSANPKGLATMVEAQAGIVSVSPPTEFDGPILSTQNDRNWSE